MSWDEAFKLIPSVVQAISILVTAIFAIISLRAWRQQLVGKRKFEIAEEIVVAAYRAREALAWIRSPISTSDEAADRKRDSHETDAIARSRDTYYVPFKRTRDTQDSFVELSKIKLLGKIHFGNQISKYVEELFKIRGEVLIAARMLSDLVGREHQEDGQSDFYKDCKMKIWATEDDNDKLTKRAAEAVDQIETICRPHLT